MCLIHPSISDCVLAVVTVGRHTCEVDTADVLEQQCAIDGVHLGAEPDLSRTKVFVHVVQSVSHGVHRVDHKLNLPLLLVG